MEIAESAIIITVGSVAVVQGVRRFIMAELRRNLPVLCFQLLSEKAKSPQKKFHARS